MSLTFSTYKMEIIIAPTSQGYCETQVRYANKAFNMALATQKMLNKGKLLF